MKFFYYSVEDHICTLIIDRPPVNAVTVEVYNELIEVLEELRALEDLRVVIFTGAGEKAFVAGADVNEFVTITPEMEEPRSARVRESLFALLDFPLPVVAAVNGPALGAGCAMACACDIRIASERARFGLPEINVGALGGGSFLGRYLPPGKLREVFFTAEPISAEDAFRLGLVEKVVPHSELMFAARELATKIAQKSPIALKLAKESLNAVEFMPLKEGYPLEQRYTARLRVTEDAREAMRAFLEKRPPRYVGR